MSPNSLGRRTPSRPMASIHGHAEHSRPRRLLSGKTTVMKRLSTLTYGGMSCPKPSRRSRGAFHGTLEKDTQNSLFKQLTTGRAYQPLEPRAGHRKPEPTFFSFYSRATSDVFCPAHVFRPECANLVRFSKYGDLGEALFQRSRARDDR